MEIKIDSMLKIESQSQTMSNGFVFFVCSLWDANVQYTVHCSFSLSWCCSSSSHKSTVSLSCTFTTEPCLNNAQWFKNNTNSQTHSFTHLLRVEHREATSRKQSACYNFNGNRKRTWVSPQWHWIYRASNTIAGSRSSNSSIRTTTENDEEEE